MQSSSPQKVAVGLQCRRASELISLLLGVLCPLVQCGNRGHAIKFSAESSSWFTVQKSE